MDYKICIEKGEFQSKLVSEMSCERLNLVGGRQPQAVSVSQAVSTFVDHLLPFVEIDTCPVFDVTHLIPSLSVCHSPVFPRSMEDVFFPGSVNLLTWS